MSTRIFTAFREAVIESRRVLIKSGRIFNKSERVRVCISSKCGQKSRKSQMINEDGV